MSLTDRTPSQVVLDVFEAVAETPTLETVFAELIVDALADEEWLRSAGERGARSYSITEVRDGTGFLPGTRFVPVRE